MANSGNVTYYEATPTYIREQEGTDPGDGGDDFHETFPNLPASNRIRVSGFMVCTRA
jgi:hypothetical protein